MVSAAGGRAGAVFVSSRFCACRADLASRDSSAGARHFVLRRVAVAALMAETLCSSPSAPNNPGASRRARSGESGRRPSFAHWRGGRWLAAAGRYRTSPAARPQRPGSRPKGVAPA